MRALVTGATATLGAALVRALLDDDAVSGVLAVGRPGDPAPAPHAKLAYRAIDLTRPRRVHDLVWGDARDLAMSVVIHGIQHRGSADGPRVHAQNVDATRELLLACTGHPTIKRFIYRSYAEVYGLRQTTSNLLDEEEPLDFDPAAPQWVRDRVEADMLVCAHLGGPLSIAVLRCAEILAPGTGSQLWDYLQSRVCLRPLGFDPMLNVLSVEDAVAAFRCALHSKATGVFNIAGADTLPLSLAIEASARADIPLPGPLLSPLYHLRRKVAGFAFGYSINAKRFHFGGVVDGRRAREELAFMPQHSVSWPQPWWQTLLARLGANRAHAT